MNDTTNDNRDFERLLEYLRERRAFDFTGYKQASLMRRVGKRMQAVGADSFDAYQDYLEVHPNEFGLLFDTILINVTAFFRDKPAWDYLRDEVVPKILEGKGGEEPVRLWSAGCSSGEEAYTLAMIMAEAMGVDTFRRQVKIYATDIDEAALAQARHAAYSAKDVEAVPPELLSKYFEQQGSRYVFRNDMRRSVIFGRNDLTQDAPISHLDLLVCRNTLMYLNAETQTRVLAHLHFALKDTGFLFLGRAEMLLTRANLFVPVSMKHRVFKRVPRVAALRERLLPFTPPANEHLTNRVAQQVRLREAAFEFGPVARLVLDLSDTLVMANEEARRLLNLGQSDMGRPFRELEISFKPADLRSLVEEVGSSRRHDRLNEVEWPSSNGSRYLDIWVVPLLYNGAKLIGTSISFVDVTDSYRLKRDLEHSKHELETAYEELQSANEELETTNEELETTNEELQSANEELETMNEELQSTNEELQTMNDELRQRTEDLNQANAFLEAVLVSMRVAAVAVDRNLTVQLWNEKAADLWGLRPDEVIGEFLLNLDIGLPLDEMKGCLRNVISGASECEELTLDATNRRGKSIRCKVTCTPQLGFKKEIQGPSSSWRR